MHKIHHALISSLLAALIATAAGCGGSSDGLDSASATAKNGTASNKGGGHGTPTGVSMSVAPNPTVLNGLLTISFWPGSLLGQQLFINWMCTQNGADVADGRSWELSYAVGNESGYSWVNDHYEWQFTIPATSVFTSGPATCWSKGLTYDFKSGYTVVAEADFAVQ